MQRRLLIENIDNIRDLGGYPAAAGQQTRWQTFVRADHFQVWTDTTQQALVDYGVRLVLDLRDPHEIQEMPSEFATSSHVVYVNTPLLTDEIHLSRRFRLLVHNMLDHYEMYRFMLDECQPQIGNIFTTIASQHTATTLFHCVAGKDRTGIVAALLLSLAGVSEDLIAQDYSLSREYLNDYFIKRRAKAAATGADMARFDQLHTYAPQTMLSTLAHLREHYHSVPDYLRTCGVSDEHLSLLRGVLL